MSNRVLCKFFAHGACFKGDQCEFSHDWRSPANNICTFYQKGVCTYGSRCRYEHVKLRKPEPEPEPSAASSSSSSYLCSSTELAPSSEPCVSTGKLAWKDPNFTLEDGIVMTPTNPNSRPEDTPLCSFAAVGVCPRGENCPHVHGDVCPSCGRHCLHPFRADEREDHLRTCEKKQKQIDALKKSQDVECGVCLDRVLAKPELSERKFGLLSNCDHAFCISCIRNWRNNSPQLGDAVRACPICRKLSHFVIPSVIWFTSEEEKQEIVQNYKAKLRSIDCKHFDFGKGNCPFGTSCFYKHAFRDGRLEEVVLRHLGSEDGQTVIAKDIRLCEFLSRLQL